MGKQFQREHTIIGETAGKKRDLPEKEENSLLPLKQGF